jgi:predicted AlkP superfamily phosphohydrolase/phosphomutase
MSKTVIIGLDGATFDIINPLAQEGRLPTLARLMREGVSAPLRSTILPNSFPGWASCTTGTSEGMHGVFSPFIKNESSYHVRAMSARDIMTRTIWDILTKEGGRSLVVNVPTTYPPEPINGMMITGMLTPTMASDFTYPSSLKEELLAAMPAYVIEPNRHPDRRVRAEGFRHATYMHELAAHFLIGRGDWDFLMVVFSTLDRAQHDYWADMDPQHPRHDPNTEFRNFIFEIYEKLDGAIARLIERLPADIRLFIVSDHGFTSELYEVRVNELLAKVGLLAFKAPTTRRVRAQVKAIEEKVRRRLFNERVSGNMLDRKVQQCSAFLDEIDWSRTRAFFAQDKGVWVNLAGREPQGIVNQSEFETTVNEARQALLELASHDGKPVFERVMQREEAFSGLYRNRLPDLVMVTRHDQYVYNERPGYGNVIVPADSTTGTHSREGIFIAWGRGIKSGARFSSQPNLRDVGPTALYSLGCPLTEDMDGRLLAEIFSQYEQPARRASSYKQVQETTVGSVYSISEEAELRKRLRSLGYVE